MAQTPTPTDPAVLTLMQGALSGDPAMLRDLMGAAGAFCVRLLVAALILAVTLWGAKRISKVVQHSIERVHHRSNDADRTLSDFITALVKYVIIAIGSIAVLQQVGVQATSVLAVLGAASLAVGLALQGTLSNVAAGVMILLLRPYRVGDGVELNGKLGKVSHLDLFNTRLTDYEGMIVYLPNGKVFGETIVNFTQSGRRRIDLTVGVDYEDDLDLALQTLIDIAAADERVFPDPKPWSKVVGMGDSSVNVTLRCWTTPDVWLDTKYDLTKQIKEGFEAVGLSFPFPHQTDVVKLVKGAPKDDGKSPTAPAARAAVKGAARVAAKGAARGEG